MASYDMIISGARVLDPESSTDGILNVAIQDGSIAALSANSLRGDTEIDGSGLALAPGFIDIHSHEDNIMAGEHEFSLPRETAACAMRGGNTLVLGGNCGFSNYPMKAYIDVLEASSLPIGTLSMVGNISLRKLLGLGNYDAPSPVQIGKLKTMASRAMEEGARGVSLGLQYAPGTSFGEILALCGAVAEQGKFFSVHMRYDIPRMARESLEEVLEAAAISGASLQISHLAANIYGRNSQGKSNVALADSLIREGIAKGLSINADSYPYDAWATSIQSAVFDNGFEDFSFTVRDLEILNGEYAGTYCSPELFEKLRAAPVDTQVACHNACPMEDLEAVYQQDYCCCASDAILSVSHDQSGTHIMGHPRSAGSPAKFLREFTREKKLFPLLSAIKKLSLDGARKLGLEKKGRIAEGCDADLVLFDPEHITEQSYYGVDNCAIPPRGIHQVIRGGTIVYRGMN